MQLSSNKNLILRKIERIERNTSETENKSYIVMNSFAVLKKNLQNGLANKGQTEISNSTLLSNKTKIITPGFLINRKELI